MDIQTIVAIVFIILLSLVLYINRRKLHMQKLLFPLLYFIMYRTKAGLKSMDYIGNKFSRGLKYIGYFAVFIGFAGMSLIAYELIITIYRIFATPEAIPGVGVVLPFEVKGAFYVPFFYWIISIFIVAVVHEFSHGVMARRAGVKLKSSGFAVLGVIAPILPAAFVEPDEKQLQKKSRADQLAVFAAGPFSNIVFAFIVLGITALLMAPVVTNLMDFNGVKITEVMGNNSAEAAGMKSNEIIQEIDGVEVNYVSNFTRVLENKKPGDKVAIKTDKKDYQAVLGRNPKNESAPYLGVYVSQNQEIKKGVIKKYGEALPALVLWFMGLLYWLYLLNFGIGLFNLVPIGPIDGGRMLKVALQRFFKEGKADRIWKNISIIFMVLVLVIIVSGFLK